LPARSASTPRWIRALAAIRRCCATAGTGAAYIKNTSGSSYADLLISYGDRLDRDCLRHRRRHHHDIQRFRLCR
jgi:hypothetical protein